MPLSIESAKVTSPRMKGQPSAGCLSFMSRSGSTFSVNPSFVRHTMACLSGPRIMMPSISACPPIIVRKQTFSLFFSDIFTSYH